MMKQLINRLYIFSRLNARRYISIGFILSFFFCIVLMRTESVNAAAGSLDYSFGFNGKVTTRVGRGSHAFSMAIQSDGKIIVAGSGDFNSRLNFALTRYNTDGSLDTSFDGDGKLITSFENNTSIARSVAIQSDGKIVVAGDSNNDFALARYNADGSLDTSFDEDGKVTTDFGNSPDIGLAMEIQSDGKIVVAGYRGASLAMARYNTDGSLDTSLDSDGKVTFPHVQHVHAIAIQPDNKILLAGYDFLLDFALVRYNTDGSLDTSFNQYGVVTTAFGDDFDEANAIAIQPDGKIIVAGSSNLPVIGTNQYSFDFALARYNSDGSLDTTFDGDGKVITDFENRGDNCYGVTIQSDGKIIAVGNSRAHNSTFNRFSLTRYNIDGSLDTTFDGDGKLTTYFGGNSSEVERAVTTQTDGKIVVAGSGGAGTYVFILARYFDNGDSDINGEEKVELSLFRPNTGEWLMQKSSNSRIKTYQFGAATDKPVSGDFDGDGKNDMAFWRPSTGEWFVLRSSNLSYFSIPFGLSTDIPTPGDFDGDSRTDFAVFRPSEGTWYIQQSTEGIKYVRFGIEGDIPVVGDYDGEGKSDVAIFRPSNSSWWIQRSRDGLFITTFGLGTDKPVPGDYTGDGKTDIALYRQSNGTWYMRKSENMNFLAVQFGFNGDIPVQKDYDGDGITDYAVFRPSNGAWYLHRSTEGAYIRQFGFEGDIPTSVSFIQ